MRLLPCISVRRRERPPNHKEVFPLRKDEKLKTIFETAAQLIVRNESSWKDYLAFASKIHKYNFDNALLIYAQTSEVTALASLAQWNKIGRSVQAVQKALRYATIITHGSRFLSPSRKDGHEKRRKSGMTQRHSDAQFRQRKHIAWPQKSREKPRPKRNEGASCCRKPPNRQTHHSVLLPGWDTALSGPTRI